MVYEGVLQAPVFGNFLNTFLLVQAKPKKDQSFDEVSQLILNEIDKIKKGQFDDSLLPAIINQLKKEEQKVFDRNSEKVNEYVECFINGIDWEKKLKFISELSLISKQDIIDFANNYFKTNYVVIKKHQTVDDQSEKITKPHITPILTNRDSVSDFFREISNIPVKDIDPLFIDLTKEVHKGQLNNGSELLYTHNITNNIFIINYIFKRGTSIDKRLPLAIEYIKHLGTSAFSNKEFGKKLYSLACDMKFGVSGNQSYISLMGLNDNLKESVDVLNSLVTNIKEDTEILERIKKDYLHNRANNKTNQKRIFKQLEEYLLYGESSPGLNVLTDEEVKNITSSELISSFLELFKYKYRILYYGPSSYDDLINLINTGENVTELPDNDHRETITRRTDDKIVYFVHYESKQVYVASSSNQQESFNASLLPSVKVFNKYFGKGMNSIVFQEMREARGLAYSANASYEIPNTKEDFYNFSTFISTQNDKLLDAIGAFNTIINNMPLSIGAFNIAKQSIINDLSTDRIIGSEILRYYLILEKLGISNDNREQLLKEINKLSIEDIDSFYKGRIKNRRYSYAILGDKDDLNLNGLVKNGFKIVYLDKEDIFGY